MSQQSIEVSGDAYDSVSDRALHLFQMSRPIWWIRMLLPITFAVLYAADSLNQVFSVTAFWFLVYFSLPGNLYVYGMNDAFDVDTDQMNPRKLDEDTPSVMYKHDKINMALILLSGVLMASIVFLSTDPLVLAPLAILASAAILYNVPPIRLKAQPFIDSFITSTLLLPPVAAYAAIAGTLPPLPIIAGSWAWGMGYHIIGAIEDIEPDREAGLTTTATFLGRERSIAFFLALWLLAPALIALESLPAAALMSVFTVGLIYTLWSDRELKDLYLAIPFINIAVFGVVIIGGVLKHV